MAFTKFIGPLDGPNPEQPKKARNRVLHTSPEFTRVFRNFPNVLWSDKNYPQLPQHVIDKTLPQLRKGICLTQAVTVDRSVYWCVTQIKSGPTCSVLETSLTRWTLTGALKFGETPESWATRLLNEGWQYVPTKKVGSKSRKERLGTKAKDPEITFVDNFLRDHADRVQKQNEISQALRHKSKVIGDFMDRMDRKTKEINDRFARDLKGDKI